MFLELMQKRQDFYKPTFNKLFSKQIRKSQFDTDDKMFLI